MKTRVCTAVAMMVLIAGIAAGPVSAQMAGDSGNRPAFREGGEITHEQFPEMKTRILSMIEERRKRLEEEKACVETASSPAELRKCRPQPPRTEGRPDRGGPGQLPQQPWQGGGSH